jgi:hypothetical protein
MAPKIKAYCPTCKKMVSDDLLETAKGTENGHEHRVVLLQEIGLIDPTCVIQRLPEITAQGYLKDASRLDAELITAKVMERFNLPLPRVMVAKMIEEIIRLIREVAVEDAKEMRKKAMLAEKKLEVEQAKKKGTKKAKAPKECPEVEVFEDSMTE